MTKKLICAENNCDKPAIKNSNYCKEHQKGGPDNGGFFENLGRAVALGIIGGVNRDENTLNRE